MKLLSIDPGLRHCGCALWADGALIAAKLVKNTEKKMRGPQAHLRMAMAVATFAREHDCYFADLKLALEYPRIYPNHSNKQAEDPNDLLELAGVDGAIVAWFACTDAKFYFPSEWKGQVPKKIMNDRCLVSLTPGERLKLFSSDHNTLDGVGVGLHYFGRL